MRVKKGLGEIILESFTELSFWAVEWLNLSKAVCDRLKYTPRFFFLFYFCDGFLLFTCVCLCVMIQRKSLEWALGEGCPTSGPVQYRRLCDRELIALSAHSLDKYGQMQFSPAGDLESIRGLAVLDPEGNICLHLLEKPRP